MGAGALERGQHTARAAVVPTRRARPGPIRSGCAGATCPRDRPPSEAGRLLARASRRPRGRPRPWSARRPVRGGACARTGRGSLGHRLDVGFVPGPGRRQPGRPEQRRGVDDRRVEASPSAAQGARQERALHPGGMGDQDAAVELAAIRSTTSASSGAASRSWSRRPCTLTASVLIRRPGSDVGVEGRLAAHPPRR